MLGYKKKKTTTISMAAVMATSLVFAGILIGSIVVPSAFAQSTGGSVEGTSEIAYRTAYPKVNAGSENSVAVQTEHHLYKPGDNVKITGSVSSEMRQETDSDTVTVRIIDSEGNVVINQQTQVNSDGEYSATLKLPANAEGTYSASTKLEVNASVLGLLDAQIVARLGSTTPASFVVASESSFEVRTESNTGGSGNTEQTFDIKIASNSTVDAVELRQEQKMVTFMVEGATGTKGVTQVTIPKAMLSGEMTVMIDGEVMSSNSDNIIVTSDTETETTFEINYSHSEHEIAVTGTNVVPEFPLSVIVMATAIGSVVSVLAIARKRSGGIGF